VILNTPNNPTGAVYPPATMAAIARWAVQHQVWILFDECYGELVLPGVVHCHPAAQVPEAAAHTITVGSFSKSFAVTGWRAGYVHAPAPVVGAIKNLQSHTTSNVTSVVQHALLPAARGELDGFVDHVRDVLRRRHAGVRAALAAIPQIAAADPQGAFYFFVDFAPVIGRKLRGTAIPDSDAIAAFLLEEVGIALTPGSAFGSRTHLRLSYAIAEDRIAEGLGRLREVMSSVE
jgi:aspartate aminotransferase